MSTTEISDREQYLDEILAAYLEAVETGWAPSRQKLLTCYPHLASDLNRFFANEDQLRQLTAPVRSSAASTLTDAARPLAIIHDPRWPILPGYEILEELGCGGMGVVYKARQLSCDRIVALKMILSGDHASAPERERLRSEALAVARLQHAGIVQLFEVGEAEGRPYLALEYVPGGSLADQLDGTPLPPRDAAALVEQLAHTVHAAHQQGVIHRDLKPANVLLSLSGNASAAGGSAEAARPQAANWIPKITDFGLAKRLDTAGPTVSGAILGTPSYMAPEQAASQKGAIGPATDVYALGALLYELLTGRPPFKAATPFDTILQVVSDEPVPPSQLQPRTPRDLETICRKCLCKDPRQRYASALALAEDLRRWLHGEPILARPLGSLERTWRWCRQHRGLAGLAATVLVTLLAGITLSMSFALQARAAERNTTAALQEKEAALRRENEIRVLLEKETAVRGLLIKWLRQHPGAQGLSRKELVKQFLADYPELAPAEPPAEPPSFSESPPAGCPILRSNMLGD